MMMIKDLNNNYYKINKINKMIKENKLNNFINNNKKNMKKKYKN